ncbi:hypothetical protein PENTCL1PPCAC_7980 [Pristionchus entomophagus]|uniref:Uncharacterized protein n=1 Tax=Pristionchus entomophagus TaxID=358040 RepID=A0AAV5SRX3_9BILA|nr:hypothetical protein PENTCL1PPCAC_7980 [Pristionchus entomophagus]
MFLLLIAFSIFLSTQAEEISTRQVTEFFEKLNEIEAANPNVINRLEAIADGSEKLMKSGAPVGALLAAGVDSLREISSAEERAFSTLQTEMIKHFGKKRGKSPFSDSHGITSEVALNYEMSISDPLNEWRKILNSLSNPGESVRSLGKEKLITLLEQLIFNKKLLKYIERIFLTKCPVPTEDSVATLIRVQTAFRFFESQNKAARIMMVHEEFNQMKKHILTHLSALSEHQRDGIVADLGRNFAERHQFLPLMEWRSECVLEVIYNSNDQNRDPLIAAVQQLASDLVQIQSMLILSAKVAIGGDSSRMRTVIDDTLTRVKLIASHVQMWVQEEQRLAWPQIGIEAAKRLIGSHIETMPVSAYNETAWAIQQVFERRGQANQSYSVLVVPTSSEDQGWNLQTDAGDYCIISQFAGIDAHVFRFGQTESFRAEEARRSMEQNTEEIREILRNGVTEYSASMMQSLNDNPRTKTTIDLHRFAILLRRTAFRQVNAEIPIGLSTDHGSICIDYAENHFWAYHWKLCLLA